MDVSRTAEAVLRHAFGGPDFFHTSAERLACQLGVLVEPLGHGGSVAAPALAVQSELVGSVMVWYLAPL